MLVDRLKRCRDFSLVKPRSDQWCGFRSGKCHSFLQIKVKISRLKAFTWVEMSEIPFTGLFHLLVGRKQEKIKASCWTLIGICRRRQFNCSGVTQVQHKMKEFDRHLIFHRNVWSFLNSTIKHDSQLVEAVEHKRRLCSLGVWVISKNLTALEK